MNENGNESLTTDMDCHQEEGLRGENIIKPLAVKGLFFDPMQVNSFLSLIDFMRRKAAPQLRKAAFERMLAKEKFIREGDVFYMTGAEYDET
ncbi:MAG: hypothetical protein LBJ72_01825 [Dysgonamonadaceae bacterium]|jgi:hypothetical protein|nr:hypothetical protein [Dysgonamonadaceae bacterium]